MNHDSWLMSHPTSNTDSQFLNHLIYPSFTPLHNLHCSKKPWIMSHDSRVILPLIFLAKDVHTNALINLWKFHRDWSSHLWVYKRHTTGFLTFLAPTNHAPVGAWWGRKETKRNATSETVVDYLERTANVLNSSFPTAKCCISHVGVVPDQT